MFSLFVSFFFFPSFPLCPPSLKITTTVKILDKDLRTFDANLRVRLFDRFTQALGAYLSRNTMKADTLKEIDMPALLDYSQVA